MKREQLWNEMGSFPLPELLCNRKNWGRSKRRHHFLQGSQLHKSSRWSRHFQVALQLPHCGFVQRAEVKVKGSVSDMKVSSFFNEVYNLQKYKQKIRIKSIYSISWKYRVLQRWVFFLRPTWKLELHWFPSTKSLWIFPHRLLKNPPK